MAISFGPDWQHELWASQYSLRFELNQGGSYINMFTSAYDRARCLARAAIPSEQLIAVIAANPNPSMELGAQWRGWIGRAAFDVLAKMGVPTVPSVASWKGHIHPHDDEDPEALLWEHRAVRVTWDQADILLWSGIGQDIGVTPQAPVLSTLVDVEHCVSVHAYDDRGMDITALSADRIAALYTRFDEWLLDYDRPRMSEAFKVGA
ncbi:MAG TPA: DUF3885 domain-containing protein [Rhizomicrobium sp.]|nr:DUF3885 domain-containing protein [Rhizomicrobium sp.]